MKTILRAIAAAVFLALTMTGCGNGKFEEAILNVDSIAITSSSVSEDGKLFTVTAAKEHNDPSGENQSPAVSWESVEGANYYAVVMFDVDANWLHFMVTDITDTELVQGAYTDSATYVGPYPPKSAGTHTYRIAVFAIKEQPNDTIAKVDSRQSYAGLVNHLNQVGGNSDNIIAYGYVEGTYTHGDRTVVD